MKLRPIKYRELIGRLKRFGLEGPFTGGKHPYFLFGGLRVTIPNPHRGEVGRDIIKSILNRLGIVLEDFLKKD